MHPATVIVMQAPKNVSNRAHFKSAKRRRLSAMQLCWKKSCQGATVVPTIAITRNIRSGVSPPGGIPGIRDPRRICPTGGCDRNAKPRKIQQAEENHDALPPAIATGYGNQNQARRYQRYADTRVYSHLVQRQIDGSELGNQSQKVYQLEIDQGKQPPPTAEPLIDHGGVALAGSDSQPDNHFLYEVRDGQ